jgi:hypothetical protein
MASRRKRLAQAEPWQRLPWYEIERLEIIFREIERTNPQAGPGVDEELPEEFVFDFVENGGV